MKKYLILAVSSLSLFSCSKNSGQEPELVAEDHPKYAVSFNVSGFTQSTEPITSGNSIAKSQNSLIRTAAAPSQPLSELVYNLYYLVYDNTGKLVSRLEQHTSEAGVLTRIKPTAKDYYINNNMAYGSFTDSLAIGNYTVVMAGAIGELEFKSSADVSGSLFTGSSLSDAMLTPKLKTVTPTFYYKGSLAVSGTTPTQNLTMNRVVSQLELKIEDAIPANAKYIYCEVSRDAPAFSLNLGKAVFPYGVQNAPVSYQVTSADIGKTGFTTSGLILNTVEPITVTIVCYDAQYKTIASKAVTNVMMRANEKTTLSGKLFDGPIANNSFVTVNQDWGTTTTIKF